MYKAKVNEGKELSISFEGDIPSIDGQPFNWDITEVGKGAFHIIHENTSYRAEVLSFDKEAKTVVVRVNNNKYSVEVKDKMDLLLERLGMDKLVSNEVSDIKAPMPGLVLDLMISEGDEVKKGDQIMILEAMKMENVIKSAGDGVVKSIKVKKGDSVEKNQVMIQF